MGEDQGSNPALWKVAVRDWGLKSESEVGMQRNKGWVF